MVKKIISRKINRFLVINVLIPLLIFVIIMAAAVGIFYELPRLINLRIDEAFGGGEQSGSYSLSELRNHFASEDMSELDAIQSGEMLSEYVDLQMKSGLYEVTVEKLVYEYVDGNLKHTYSVPMQLNFGNNTEKFTTPWQLMSAVDLVNENFGITERSDEVTRFNELLRPRFDGNISSSFIPTVYETITSESRYTTRTVNRIDYATGEPFEVAEIDTDKWVVKTVTKIPRPIFESVDYYGGQVNNEIIYTTHVDEPVSDYQVLYDNAAGKETQRITTTVTREIPSVSKSNYEVSTSKLTTAITSTIPIDMIELYIQIMDQYTSGYALSSLLTTTSLRDLIDFELENYSERIYSFEYPTLKHNETGRYYREDLVNLALSLKGLDYFWGGKDSSTGFNPRWGKLVLVSAAGHPASGNMTRYGLDCSGFAQWVYVNAGLPLSGSSREMLRLGQIEEIQLSEIKPGDIGLYHNYSSGEAYNHVGIFIEKQGDNYMFAHSGGYAWADADHPLGQVTVSALNKTIDGNARVKFKKFYRYSNKPLN
ncbi:MAG: C40 family peptidase [Clostridia bacterium]|nr:C40 family peptidase [Clostridia bacterium]